MPIRKLHQRSIQFIFVACCLLYSRSAGQLEPAADYVAHAANGSEVIITCGSGAHGAHKVRLRFRRPTLVEVTFVVDGDLRQEIFDQYNVWLKQSNWPEVSVAAEDAGEYVKITSPALTVRAYKSPFRLEFWDASNSTYIAGDAKTADNNGVYGLGGYLHDTGSGAFVLRKQKSPTEHFFGFGDNCIVGTREEDGILKLDKTGETIDTWGFNPQGHPGAYTEYKWRGGMIAPFFYSTDGYGIFVHMEQDDELHRFEMGSVEPDVYSAYVKHARKDHYYEVNRERSQLVYLFMHGPDYPHVVEQYTEAAGVPDQSEDGRPPFLTKWVYGILYGASKWQNVATIKEHVATMRDNNLPFDLIIGDWQFCWEPTSAGHCFFPENESDELLGFLDENGVKYGVNADVIHNSGMVKCDYDGPNDDHVETAQWYVDHGFDVQWSDSWVSGGNDPSTSHRGARETFLAFREAFGGDESRCFMVTGWGNWVNHAFPATWPGDHHGSTKTDLGGAMVGQSHFTHDWGKGPHQGEYDAWEFVKHGASPIVRYHAAGWGGSFAYAYNEQMQEIYRKWTAFRYRLIPYLFTCGGIASEKGYPIMRHMIWEHPKNPTAWDKGDANPFIQFYLGDWLLAAPYEPSYHSGEQVSVWIPGGIWYDFFEGTKYEGEQTITCDVGGYKLPLFARAGAIIPMGPPMQWVGQVPEDPLTLNIWPHGNSSFTLYEDVTPVKTTFECRHQQGKQTMVVVPPFGGSRYSPADRAYRLQVHGPKPLKVFRDCSSELPARESRAALESAASGWFYEQERGGVCHIRPDGDGERGFSVVLSYDGSCDGEVPVTKSVCSNRRTPRFRVNRARRTISVSTERVHEVAIMDVRGRIVARFTGVGQQTYALDKQSLPAGFYIARLNSLGTGFLL